MTSFTDNRATIGTALAKTLYIKVIDHPAEQRQRIEPSQL